MKYLLFVFFLALGLNSFCQADRFLFLQSQKGEQFYVTMGEKTFNSSLFGHLVIPRLNNGSHKLLIGLSRQSIPEQEFIIKINGKDLGFEIQRDNNQYILYDWQNSGKILSSTLPVEKEAFKISGIKRMDPFALLMAGVVNDSLVLYIEKSPVKSDLATSPVKNESDDLPVFKNSNTDSAAAKRSTAEIKSDPNSVREKDTMAIAKNASPAEPFRRAVNPPVKSSEELIIEKDTITSFSKIVSDSIQHKNLVKVGEDSVGHLPVAEVPSIVLIEESSSPDEKKMIFQVMETKEKIDVIIKKDSNSIFLEPKPEIAKTEKSKLEDATVDSAGMVLINSDCQKYATDTDVDRLRVQMLKETNDDDRVFAARKVFRTKCFTVKQVTALTELFKDDSGRYMFFDAAYPFIYDSGNFKSLIRLLTEEYYINRFKALVRM